MTTASDNDNWPTRWTPLDLGLDLFEPPLPGGVLAWPPSETQKRPDQGSGRFVPPYCGYWWRLVGRRALDAVTRLAEELLDLSTQEDDREQHEDRNAGQDEGVLRHRLSILTVAEGREPGLDADCELKQGLAHFLCD